MGFGDEIMVAGRARVLQQTDPRKCRVTFCGKLKWNSIWDNNPRIARIGERGDFQELVARDVNNSRPYHTKKTPERWSYNLAFRPNVGEIYFTDAELEFGARYAARVIIEPHNKPKASPNKEWGWMRWNKLAYLLDAAGIRCAQMGPMGTRTIDRVELIETPNFRFGCAVLAGARACVLPEGGLHHAAAALNVPGVVIFGGYIAVETTGYPMHTNLGVHVGEACGMRIPCEHCQEEMAKITPHEVCDELMRLMGETVAA